MKNIQKSALALLFVVTMAAYGCGPNDSKGSMSKDNSNGEGAVDSSRLSNFDSTTMQAHDSSKLK